MRREICLGEEATFTNSHKGAFKASGSPMTLLLGREQVEDAFASGTWHTPCLPSLKYSHSSLPSFRSLLKWHL